MNLKFCAPWKDATYLFMCSLHKMRNINTIAADDQSPFDQK